MLRNFQNTLTFCRLGIKFAIKPSSHYFGTLLTYNTQQPSVFCATLYIAFIQFYQSFAASCIGIGYGQTSCNIRAVDIFLNEGRSGTLYFLTVYCFSFHVYVEYSFEF